MSKEGEGGPAPLRDSKGGIPGPSGAGQFDAGSFAEAPSVASLTRPAVQIWIDFAASYPLSLVMVLWRLLSGL